VINAVVLATESGSGTVTVIVAVVGGLATVGAAFVTANGVRRQTTPERKAHREGATPTQARGTVTPANEEVAGYIVRFFIFSLVAALWSALLNIVLPLLTIESKVKSLAAGIVYSAIFLALGLPLLVDIYRGYGIRGRPRRHLRN
jgi:hypothetical protein